MSCRVSCVLYVHAATAVACALCAPLLRLRAATEPTELQSVGSRFSIDSRSASACRNRGCVRLVHAVAAATCSHRDAGIVECHVVCLEEDPS